MEPSVFTRILAGEIPGEILHRDDVAAALLTIQPFTPGHVLVIPVAQVDHLWDLDEETYGHVMALAHRIGKAIRVAYPEYRRVGVAVEGFEVPHAHVHVFGTNAGMRQLLADVPAPIPFATPAEMAEVAGRLRAALDSLPG